MGIFTMEELEELRRADADIEKTFKIDYKEISESKKTDYEIKHQGELEKRARLASYHRKWSAKNKEKRAAYKREWYEQNKEHCRAYKREYYEQNKESLNAYWREWYRKKKEATACTPTTI